jgi:hypothetical protein
MTAPAVKVHDIGLRMHRNGAGETGFEVIVGGGLGRRPFIGKTIKTSCRSVICSATSRRSCALQPVRPARQHLQGAHEDPRPRPRGEKFAREVEEEWQSIKDGPLALDPAVVADIAARFRYPQYELLADNPPELASAREDDRFRFWLDNAVSNHKIAGHAIVTLSLKPEGGPPGDATAAQMDAIAELADRFSHGEIRVGHEQNLALPHVAQRDLPALWRALDGIGVATPNVNLISDIIACPGLDYCSLANARSIPVAEEITRRFRDLDLARKLGPLHINISGCINACGHHHIGHIGILGVEKNGEEYYQVTIGGRADESAELGAISVRRCPMPRLPMWSRTSPPPTSSCARGRTSFSSIPSCASASIPSGSAFMPLVKAGRVVEDRFVRVVDDAAVPDGAAATWPAARFLADSHDLVLRQAPTGVVWPNDRKVAELAPYLDWIALVALVFPTFRDGRAYSQARLLRERYHFRGELRATGQVCAINCCSCSAPASTPSS